MKYLWLKDVKPEDLPEPFDTIERAIGLEHALEVWQILEGTQQSIKTIEKGLIQVRNRVIRRKFNGSNHNELVREYDLSYRSICYIVNQQDPRQILLFPDAAAVK